MLKKVTKHTNNGPVIPHYYYVPRDFIDFERARPGSQERLPSPEIEHGSTHLWSQAILFICELLG